MKPMKILLINMPFSSLFMPSIALTQLKSIVEMEFGPRVSIEILYLNHQFGAVMGMEGYSYISESMQGHQTGLGDWFFRQAAFPHLPDNSQQYFLRYGLQFGGETMAYFDRHIKAMRNNLNGYLDQLIELHRIDQADVVGFSSMFFQTLASAAMANRIKAKNPNIITVIGGANCEAQMGIELAHHLPSIDYAFSGPALVSFPQFIRHCLEGKQNDREAIDGVFSKRNTRSVATLPETSATEKEGCHQLNGVGVLGRELDINVPIALDYDSFLDSFHKTFPKAGAAQKPFLLFETSRGCWWGQKSHCTFCGLNGGTMNYRAMQVDKARDLVEDLFRRYSNRVDQFSSVDNILPKNYLTDFLPQLNVPSNVSLFYEVKADLKEEEVKTLAKAHVFKVQPGIESLASSTLRLMRKGTTAFGNIQFLRRVAVYGIQPIWNLLLGFPGEKEDVYEKYITDIPLLTHLPPPSGAFPVRFDRFSPYFDLAAEYKLDLRPLDFYSLSYPFAGSVLQNMAYYFYDNNYKADYAVNVARYVKQLMGQVEHWQTRWWAKDKMLPSCLYFKVQQPNVVYDSRSGIASEHVLSESEFIILKGLENPLDLELLSKNHSQFSRPDIEQTLSSLTSKGLLFAERDRWISLVSPSEPKQRQKHH